MALVEGKKTWEVVDAYMLEQQDFQRQVARRSSLLLEAVLPVLESADASVLRRLKKKLERFNSTTGGWK